MESLNAVLLGCFLSMKEINDILSRGVKDMLPHLCEIAPAQEYGPSDEQPDMQEIWGLKQSWAHKVALIRTRTDSRGNVA